MRCAATTKSELARDHQVAKLECDRQVVKLGVLSKTITCSGGSSRGISAPTGASSLLGPEHPGHAKIANGELFDFA